MGKKLSIITVCFNAAKTIENTIKSLADNKNSDIEYLIIDGGSKDETMQIANRYKGYIDCIISEKDNGIYDALNKGIKLAKGEYIMLLAADDVLIDGGIQQALKTLNSDTDIWCGSIILKTDYGYFIEHSSPNLEGLKYSCTLRNPAALFRKTIFDKWGYYDTSYRCSADRELFLRMYINGCSFQIEKIPITLFGMEGISSLDRTKYAIPEGRRIELQYNIESDGLEERYEYDMKKEKLKNTLRENFIGRLFFRFMYSDMFYPLVCSILKKENTKLNAEAKKKYGFV